jgi:hypothetical protein
LKDAAVLVLGGNTTTLAVVNAFPPAGPGTTSDGGSITARLIPLAWTPLGIAIGDTRQEVSVPLSGLFDWMDRTFPPEDEHAFVAPLRDVELLSRIGWSAAFPDRIDESNVVNVEDLPDEIVDALAQAPVALVQCAACRRLCVSDDFVWKEKQLCAWDYHAQVFGRRGPWHDGPYEERHFETLPSCAYVAAPLLAERSAEAVMSVSGVAEPVAAAIVNALLVGDPGRPHMAVRTQGGFTVLREA